MTTKLTLKNYPKNQKNPFIENAIVNIQEKSVAKKQYVQGDKTVQNLIVNDNGEVLGASAFMRFVQVDEEKFAKIYLSQFEAFWELSKSAIRVFGYIMNSVMPNHDFLFFDMNECKAFTKYHSHVPINKGLTDLISAGIIARGKNEYMYFINPLVFFNGNRVTFATTYIKKKRIDSDPNQTSLLDQPGVMEVE